MKRFLLLAALCLFSVPAKATIFDLPLNGTVQITGDFVTTPNFTAEIYWYAQFVGYLPPLATTDIYNGVSYSVTSRINGNKYYADITNVAGGNCRLCYIGANSPTLNFPFYGSSVNDFRSDEPYTITTSTVFSHDTPGSFIVSMAISLPDNFNIAAAVPETSKWVMMLLGFAGVGFMAWHKRNKAFRLA